MLAGGRALRAGGRDKGLLEVGGVPMAGRAVGLLTPVCDAVIISANRNLDRYAALADGVVADRHHGFLGPLAGLAACMSTVSARWVLTSPCDAVNVPPQLPWRLLLALRLNGVHAAVAHDAERRQPLLGAFRGDLGASVDAYLARGGRSAQGWLDTLKVVEVRVGGVIGNRNR